MIKAVFFDESDGGKVSARSATILTPVNSVGVDGSVYGLLPFQAKDKIEVSFVQVDDSKAVDFKIAFLFENHHVNNIFPSGKSIVVLNGIIDHVLVNRRYPGLKDRESLTLGLW